MACIAGAVALHTQHKLTKKGTLPASSARHNQVFSIIYFNAREP